MINTRFWQDAYASDLDPVEKLMFLYCLTNNYSTLGGIYEIPLKIIAVETGLDKEMVEKILKRFEKDGKIVYKDGWMAIKNFIKHHEQGSPQVKAGIAKDLVGAPDWAKRYVLGEGIDTLSPLALASASASALASTSKTSAKESFEAFWKLYPRKIAKKSAWKAWLKVEPESVPIIMHALPDHIASDQWQRDGGKYIPHPATWLNAERWLDEVETSAPNFISFNKK